jgi:hypothetical protein
MRSKLAIFFTTIKTKAPEITGGVVIAILLGIWQPRIALSFGIVGVYLVVLILFQFQKTRNALERGRRDIQQKKIEGIILLVIILFFRIWNPRGELVFFLFLLLAFPVYRWSGRIPALAALVSTLSCVTFLLLKQDKIAATLATYTFYFLATAVLAEISLSFKKS